MSSAIGRRVRHVDWRTITDGSARYADDVPAQALVAQVVRSPHPHARIVSIDLAAARRIPGVAAVLSAADLPDRMYLDYRVPDRDRYILARDVVRYVGEPVVLVAADDQETAARAAAAVRVRYRRLPALDTAAKALAPDAAAIHPERSADNVASRVHRQYGADPDALPDPAHRIRAHYRSSRQTHVTMEPHTVMADWSERTRRLEVWAPSQNPRLIRRDLAQLFDLDPESVHLNGIEIGGDFGGRTQISSTEALVCALAIATGRRVKLRQSRAEEFAFTKYRVPWELDLDLGCDAEGRVTALRASFEVDNGAYNQAGPGEMDYGATALAASYRWQGYRADGRCVYTSKVPSPPSAAQAATRSPGRWSARSTSWPSRPDGTRSTSGCRTRLPSPGRGR